MGKRKHELRANESINVFMLLYTNRNMQLMRKNSLVIHVVEPLEESDALKKEKFFLFVFLAKTHKCKKEQSLNEIHNTRANGKD